MKIDIHTVLEHDQLRKEFLRYTHRAFKALPSIDRPRILDIGCGSGIPSIELARLSDGEIIGIDSNAALINTFNEKIKDAGLSDRVKAMVCSIQDMDFPDAYFDVLWAEGVVHIIGFAESLTSWRRFIKSKGFLVVHDDVGDIDNKRARISQCGYKMIQSFCISGDEWWQKYYHPLEIRINKLRRKYSADQAIQAQLDREQQWVKAFLTNPDYYGSIFYIIQKRVR
jgi:ubiquinone/menaquinone biosynthesis C-methylase UbiE